MKRILRKRLDSYGYENLFTESERTFGIWGNYREEPGFLSP